MRTIKRGNFKTGLDSLRGSKLRNFWTMLGVIIGVASVISIVGIGEGVKQQVASQVHQFGDNTIAVQPAELQSSGKNESIGSSLLPGLSIVGSLSPNDVATVSHTAGVSASAPLSVVAGQPSGTNGMDHQALVMGTTPDLANLLSQSLAYGSFLDDSDNGMHVAVLGQQAVSALFKDDVPLGETFTFHGQQFLVIGIFNQFETTPLSQQTNFNNAIFIPYDVSQTLTNGTASTFEILAKANVANMTDATIGAIRSNLAQTHGGSENFTVQRETNELANSNMVLELLTRLIAGASAISLIVGGIGIMNVMLVSVAERLHEIGIRKAIGATNRQILSQFLIESTVLSVSGGVIGIGIAYVVDVGLRVATSLQPLISWQIVVTAFGVSLLVGIIFGTIPALKAARMDPIEALRSE